MRYAAPLAMPIALGEWLGAELEARGVEAASHYARAVLSILLHSDLEPDFDVENEAAKMAALELQIQLEQQKEKEKRGRSRAKNIVRLAGHSRGKGPGAAAKLLKANGGVPPRRRPHSWNGDEDGLKKSAAIECLLSATDSDEWSVEKFVDELVTRLKILQLEGMDRFRGLMGSSAPNFAIKKDIDSDSLTSVSTPGEPEDYLTAFPPLLDGDDDSSVQGSISWGIHRGESQPDGLDLGRPRVPFVRVPGTRLSPSPSPKGPCTSSPVTVAEQQCGSYSKGRLYERGLGASQESLDVRRSMWADWSDPGKENIWAPDQQDWTILGKCHTELVPLVLDPVMQKSLAALNHHPQQSSFARVTPGHAVNKAPGPANSGGGGGTKIFEWMGALDGKAAAGHDDEEIENLLISPKTHFCPIQEETDAEVNIRDGVTFDIDADPDEVHYLRSPNGALYLPQIEDNGFGWVGWIKYTIYNPPTPDCLEDDDPDVKLTSAFPLKFKIIQNDKGCQTDLGVQTEEEKTLWFSPFGLVDAEMWKFNVETLDKACPEEKGEMACPDDEEEGDFLKEVWQVTVEETPEVEEDPSADDGLFLDEVWQVTVDTVDSDSDRNVAGSEDEGFMKDVWNCAAAPVTDVAIGEQEEDFIDEGSCHSLNESVSVNGYATSDGEEILLDEIWNPLIETDDVCEWLAGEENLPEGHEDLNWLMTAEESWPPPHIPIEYVDDELFEEIIGSVESKGSLSGASGVGGKRKSRRRRRSGKKQQQNSTPPQRRRPCSFFVEGGCLQPDCKYSHDLGSIPCRFWLESACFKGVACPFMHAKPSKSSTSKSRSRNRSCSQSDASEGEQLPSRCVSQRKSRNNSTSSKTFELDLDHDFPSLSQAAEEPYAKAKKSQPIPIRSGDKSARTLKADTGVRRRRKKPLSGQHSLKTDATMNAADAPVRNTCSLENGIGRLRLLSSYKEG